MNRLCFCCAVSFGKQYNASDICAVCAIICVEDEPEKYHTHFIRFIKKGVESDGIEEMYNKVHAALRADPTPKKSQKEPPKEHKRHNLKKLTYEERKARLIERLNALNSAAGGGDDDDDEDDDDE
ncbi:large ribosomal subunit protein uL18-like [Rhododendron vialii]|uniref:large ribosomal subunit protein uL18-like n=1 Tax=Rhododendron vialii TaxID=182163 RepID=UPI00265E760B|nr:large ribosomal subunit protein uL18-like [Rhododendron vialii]